MSKYWLNKVILLIILLSSTIVFAQSDAGKDVKSDTANNEAQSQTQEGTQETGASSADTSGLVSLDFRDADIKTILQVLSLKSGVNIVTSPEVQGVISIQLNNVPWQQALDIIVSTNGYATEKRQDVIVVSTIESLKKRREDNAILAEQEPLETKTFTLNFSVAGKVVDSVTKMKSERGKVDFDERTNTIIATDTAEKLKLIADVIKKLDQTTNQVLIEGKIVETTLSNSEELGIDWTAAASMTGTSMPIIWPFDNESSSRFAPYAIPDAPTEDYTTGTLSFAQAQAVFDALKSRTDTNILSNPRIVTLDNQAAEIVVGSQYPIPTYTYNEDQGKLQVSGWTYMDIGIIFNVTPHVNNAGFVTLEIEPKITAILDYVTVEGTSMPTLSNESSKTIVMVKNHDTLVIGGLLKDQTTKTNKRLPFLGDIPILGLLFQKKDDTITKQDLLIFMTPHIITPKLEPAKS